MSAWPRRGVAQVYRDLSVLKPPAGVGASRPDAAPALETCPPESVRNVLARKFHGIPDYLPQSRAPLIRDKQSAIDRQCHTSNPLGSVGGKKQDRLGNVPRLSRKRKRLQCSEPGLIVMPNHLVCHCPRAPRRYARGRRRSETREDSIHSNAIWS